MAHASTAESWTRIGLVTLPAYGLLLAASTLTPQPDQTEDPAAWAQFVTAPGYLVEHVLSSLVGAVLVILGTVALGAFLASGLTARLAVAGMVVAVAGQVLLMVPGVISTFVTPAIGAAYLNGNTDVMSLQFQNAVTVTFMLALVLTVAGNVVLGVAVWRSRLVVRWAGAVWAAGAVVFYLAGAFLGMATTGASLPTQPVGGLMMAASGVAIAWSGLHPHRVSPATVEAAANANADGR